MRPSLRRAALAAWTLLLGTGTAVAAPRTLSVTTAGSSAEPAASALVAEPPPSWEVTRTRSAVSDKPLGADAFAAKNRDALVRRARASAEAAGTDAVVVLKVARLPHGRRLTMLVVDARGDAAPREVEVVLGSAPSPKDGETIARSLAGSLGQVPAPPAPAEPTPAPAPRAESPITPASVSSPSPRGERDAVMSPPPASGSGSTFPFVRLAVAPGIATRNFGYRDGLSPGLRTYELGAVPTASAHVEVNPLAGSTNGAIAGLGLYGDATFAVGLSSATSPNGDRIDTTWRRWGGGIRALVPIARGRFALGGSFGYGRETFTIEQSRATEGAPDVDYAFLRPALEGRATFGRWTGELGAAYLPVLSGAALEGRARGTSVAGVEARAGVRVALGRYVDVSANAGYTRFFYAFSPEPGDPVVAGGALDQIARGELALAGRY